MRRSLIGFGAVAGFPEMGLLDFAGGTVVHVTAGVAAVVAAMVMGAATWISQSTHATAQHDHDHHRCRLALGGLVWFQTPVVSTGRQRRCRHGDAGDPCLRCGRGLNLDGV